MREPSPSAIEDLWKRYLNHVVLFIAVKKLAQRSWYWGFGGAYAALRHLDPVAEGLISAPAGVAAVGSIHGAGETAGVCSPPLVRL
jgi:hypothetical protein